MWAGIILIFFYMGQIFKKLTKGDVFLYTLYSIIGGLVKFIAALFTFPLIKKFSRKFILSLGSTILMLSFTCIAICIKIGDEENYLLIITILLFICIFTYGSTWAQLTWVLLNSTYIRYYLGSF